MIRWTSIFVAALFLQGCNRFLSNTPALSFVNNNVLMPEISVSTHDSSSMFVEYWKEGQLEKKRTIVSNGKDHQFILFNLTEKTNYSYRLRSTDGNKESEIYQFVTGPIPEEVLKIRKDKIDSTTFTGYILIRRFFKSGADILLNNKGEIVWYNLFDTVVRRPNYWTKNKTILSIYDTAQIIETNLTGQRLLDLDLFALENPHYIHHEILEDSDGKIVTLTADSIQLDARRFGGTMNQFIYGDGIVKLSRKGETRWRWSIFKMIDLPRVVKGLKNLSESIGHANSIAIDKDENYLISFRDFDQVWKINSQSGEVMWKFGKGGDFKMDPENYFLGQHSIHFNKLGHLMMFDNGDVKIRPNSRVLAFSLDEKNKVAKAELIINLPKSLSSYRMCSAYQIDEDRYLICTSRQYVTLSVINRKGDILWKVGGDHSSYRAYYIDNPFPI